MPQPKSGLYLVLYLPRPEATSWQCIWSGRGKRMASKVAVDVARSFHVWIVKGGHKLWDSIHRGNPGPGGSRLINKMLEDLDYKRPDLEINGDYALRRLYFEHRFRDGWYAILPSEHGKLAISMSNGLSVVEPRGTMFLAGVSN